MSQILIFFLNKRECKNILLKLIYVLYLDVDYFSDLLLLKKNKSIKKYNYDDYDSSIKFIINN